MPLALMLLGAAQEDSAGRVKQLVAALASEDLETRDRAGKDLVGIGVAARAALEGFRDHPDPEVRGRIRDLLGRVEFLRVDAALRDPLKRLGKGDVDDIKAAVKDLLKADRGKVKESLKACAEGSATLKFRAGQLLDGLVPEATRGLRYGALLPKAEYAIGEDIQVVEYWINESDKEMRLWDVSGHPKKECLGPAGEGLRGNLFILEEPHGLGFILEPGGVRVGLGGHLFSVTKAWTKGGYVFWQEYTSDGQYVREKDRKGFWTGTLKSARVGFQVP